METFFTSDLHFGHKNVLRFDDRPFTSVEEMDAAIIKNWNDRVGKTDRAYILGDVSWYNTRKTEELLGSLNGHKILIAGNHDNKILSAARRTCDSVTEYQELHLDGNQHLVMMHYPITFFNRHHYGAVMLYGHVHNSHEWQFVKNYQRELHELDIKCDMCNVGTMVWDYKPVTYEEIRDRIKSWGCA